MEWDKTDGFYTEMETKQKIAWNIGAQAVHAHGVESWTPISVYT